MASRRQQNGSTTHYERAGRMKPPKPTLEPVQTINIAANPGESLRDVFVRHYGFDEDCVLGILPVRSMDTLAIEEGIVVSQVGKKQAMITLLSFEMAETLIETLKRAIKDAKN